MIKCDYCKEEFTHAGFKLTPANGSSGWAYGNFCDIKHVIFWMFKDHKVLAHEILKEIEAQEIVDAL